jgi:predicted site-specific integrase-resolvase
MVQEKTPKEEPFRMDIDGSQPRWLRSKEAREVLRISGSSLNKWARAGTIPTIVLPGTGDRRVHRLYDVSGIAIDGVRRRSDGPEPSDGGPIDVLYARVSTRKQQPDLRNQIEALRAAHPHVQRVITDVCSGINFNRSGLTALLDLAFQGRLRTVSGSVTQREGSSTRARTLPTGTESVGLPTISSTTSYDDATPRSSWIHTIRRPRPPTGSSPTTSSASLRSSRPICTVLAAGEGTSAPARKRRKTGESTHAAAAVDAERRTTETQTMRCYRIRMRPNAAQRRELVRWFECSRWAYNAVVASVNAGTVAANTHAPTVVAGPSGCNGGL